MGLILFLLVISVAASTRVRRRPSTKAAVSGPVLPTVLQPLAGPELRLRLTTLGPMNPGLVQLWRTPERHLGSEGEPLTVLGTTAGGLWFVLADDGSVHRVDDVALGTRSFPTVDAFATELRNQNTR